MRLMIIQKRHMEVLNALQVNLSQDMNEAVHILLLY